MRHASHIVLLAAAALLAPAAGAQACDSVTSRTALATFAGERVTALRIVTEGPAPLPGAASVADNLHVRTREATVRRFLLFRAGEALDTVKVAESLRRLRGERYLADASITGVRCAGIAGVALTVHTTDAWSTRPRVQSSGSSSVVGVTERNVLGTGREASVYVRSAQSRIGIGAALRDPWLLGTRVSAQLYSDSYRDGHDWGIALGSRAESVLDRWRSGIALSRMERLAPATGGDAFRRENVSLLVMRRARVSESAVTSLMGGATGERTALAAGADAIVLGPTRVDRAWAGLDLGVQRRAAAWDTLTWLLPRAAIVDVPAALEGEILVGGGTDFASGAPGARLDAWVGRMWMPSRTSLLVADLWASGYRIGHRVDAGTLRGSLVWFRAAPRGTWNARLDAEHLFNPDPDVRALASTDATLGAVPSDSRLAEAALAGSVERAVHLFGLSRSWGVDGAAFGAASIRWDPVTAGPESLHAAIVGLGLRLAPARAGRGTARLDVGYPVFGSAAVRRRPMVLISVAPWLGESRRREGTHDR